MTKYFGGESGTRLAALIVGIAVVAVVAMRALGIQSLRPVWGPSATPLKSAISALLLLTVAWGVFKLVDEMAGFWWKNRAPRFWERALWFVVLLFWPVGELVYYFVIYRNRHRRPALFQRLGSPTV